MLTVFWDRRRIVKIDFLDKGSTMTGAYYSELLQDARKSRRKSPGVPLWFLHDNAPIHTCNVSTNILEHCGFKVLQHPPYSPDLAPSDFALFRHLKKELRGHQFSEAAKLKDAVTEILGKLPKEFFENAFEDLIRRWKKCVEQNGSYVEK